MFVYKNLKIYWPGTTDSTVLGERKDLEPYRPSCTGVREVNPVNVLKTFSNIIHELLIMAQYICYFTFVQTNRKHKYAIF